MTKRVLRIFAIMCLIIGLGSCEKFIDKLPEDTLSPGGYFNNTEELLTGVSGSYKVLQAIYQHDRMIRTLAYMGSTAKTIQLNNVFRRFEKSVSNSESNIYTDNFLMISRCNSMLKILENFTTEVATEKREVDAMIGECHFLRGLAYFNLVRLYGELPLVIEELASPMDAFGNGRSSVNDIYNLAIIPDFTKAAELCYKKDAPELSGQAARATKGSGLMGLAKAYLTINKTQEAEDVLKRLIVDKEGGEYELLSDMSDVFKPENKFNKESIFEVNYNVAAGQPSWYFTLLQNDIGYAIGMTRTSGVITTHSVLREFDEYGENNRFYATLDSGVVNGVPPIQAFPVKMAPPREERSAINDIGSDYNFMVYRYADALLMYGEALMRNGKDGKPWIDMVRQRSGMPKLDDDPKFTGLDIYWILHERRMELLWEAHYYFDLVRTGKAVEILSDILMQIIDHDNVPRNTPVPEYQLLLPIPTGEIEKDQSLVQNPGY
jgi:starch-binding outer membrane protein, SusD/RagB family